MTKENRKSFFCQLIRFFQRYRIISFKHLELILSFSWNIIIIQIGLITCHNWKYITRVDGLKFYKHFSCHNFFKCKCSFNTLLTVTADTLRISRICLYFFYRSLGRPACGSSFKLVLPHPICLPSLSGTAI